MSLATSVHVPSVFFFRDFRTLTQNKNHGGVLNDHWRRGLGWVNNKIYFLFFSQTSRPIIKEKKKKSAGDPKHIFLAAS